MNVKLIVLRIKRSIGMFFLCTNFSDFLFLDDHFVSRKFKTQVAFLFTALSNKEREIRVDSLTWKVTNFTRCAEYLCRLEGLSLLSDVYHMAQQIANIEMNDADIGFMPIMQLPYEVIEIIIQKAAYA